MTDNNGGYWILAMGYVIAYAGVVLWRVALRLLNARMR
jgi:hypothetical protein